MTNLYLKYFKKGIVFGLNQELLLLLGYSLFVSGKIDTKTKIALLSLHLLTRLL